jgi:hypothetical protein
VQKYSKYLDETFMISDIDFSPIVKLLNSLYSPDPRGRKPRDPVCILRSLILMVIFKEPSITKWVKRLRTDELICTLAGWEPGKSPVSVQCTFKYLQGFYPVIKKD